jgi:hypothetical protein
MTDAPLVSPDRTDGTPPPVPARVLFGPVQVILRKGPWIAGLIALARARAVRDQHAGAEATARNPNMNKSFIKLFINMKSFIAGIWSTPCSPTSLAQCICTAYYLTTGTDRL